MVVSIDRRRALSGVAHLIFAGTMISRSYAQFSSQTIRIIYPFAAGSAADALTRIVAARISVSLSQPVIVENRIGASGRVGTKSVIDATPDGTTLLLAPNPVICIYPHSYASLGFDPETDLKPISLLSTFDMALVVAPYLEIATVDELIRWIKANPNKANCGSSGAGGLSHFLAVMFASYIGAEVTHVHYRGNSGVVNDIAADQIPFAFVSAGEIQELYSANKVKVVGTLGTTRSASLSGVKTFRESNIMMNGQGWYGLYAPAGTSPELVERLNRIVAVELSNSEIKNRIEKFGLTVQTSTPDQLATLQKKESEMWRSVVKASGFTALP